MMSRTRKNGLLVVSGLLLGVGVTGYVTLLQLDKALHRTIDIYTGDYRGR